MTCKKCSRTDLVREDFYWRKNNPSEKTHANCKVCERKKNVEKSARKRANKEDFLHAYFS